MSEPRTAMRWLYVWIAVGVVVVAALIGFLFPIANNLESIDGGLEEASEAVSGVEEDVDPLPEHIARINESLSKVEDATEPLPKKADRVIGNLGSIGTTLQGVEGTLNTTERHLDTTAALLVDTRRSLVTIDAVLERTLSLLGATAGTLVTTDDELESAFAGLRDILALARRIDHRLELAQDRDSLGTNAIWRHVRFLNGGRFVRRENDAGLREVRRDTTNIVLGLDEVNEHLESACMVIPQVGEVVPLAGQSQAAPRQAQQEPQQLEDPDREPPDGPPC